MAPRSINDRMTFEQIEEEILFTRASLKADPNAEDLLPLTDSWMSLIEAPRTASLADREAYADAAGLRSVANHYMDAICRVFADQLFLDVGKDRTDPRWTQFFDRAVSRFVRLPLAQQVNTVRGWLRGEDVVLEPLREDMDMWADRCGEALVRMEGTATARGRAAIARETLAEDLTAARDGLHEALAARARTQKLGRSWPDVFFRKGSSKRRQRSADGETPTE